jgi:hypothetical protein
MASAVKSAFARLGRARVEGEKDARGRIARGRIGPVRIARAMIAGGTGRRARIVLGMGRRARVASVTANPGTSGRERTRGATTTDR